MKKISKVLAVMLTIGILMNIVPIVAEASIFQVVGRVYNHSVDPRNDHSIMGNYSSAGQTVGVDVTACEVTKPNTSHNLWVAYCFPDGSGYKPGLETYASKNFTNVADSRYYTFDIGFNLYRNYQIWFSTNQSRTGRVGQNMAVHATVWCRQN